MKVQDLIAKLQQCDPSAKVEATWEGTRRSLDVYEAADGCVLVDADANFYKCRWQKTPCVVCGKQAMGTPFDDKPVCYTHWKTYHEETV